MQEVDGLRRFHLARTEERGRRPLREGQGRQQHHRKADAPKDEKNAAGLEAERFRLLECEPSEGGDQRDGDIGDHRHLQQHDEAVAGDLEEPRHLAEEHAGRNAKNKPDQHLFGQPQPTFLGGVLGLARFPRRAFGHDLSLGLQHGLFSAGPSASAVSPPATTTPRKTFSQPYVRPGPLAAAISQQG